ncbi:uncharacterized protein LOC143281480 [Babylonia areolata]|uniref:uncharacterized protein LOC143281480 n=1 Tax=Babylonia areolata TaxID=304850 RepID=UPI003FD53E67
MLQIVAYFDSIDRESLWKLLRHYGVPIKLVNLIKNSYEGMRCRVVHGGQLTDSFEVKTGARQGCLLSPFLFLLAIDWTMKTSTADRRNGIQWTLLDQLDDLDFADDLALLSHNHQKMQDKTTELAATSSQVGPNIHKGKTKILKINTAREDPVTVHGSKLEEVEAFTYLGSIIDKQGGTDADVRARIGKARAAYLQIKNIWSSKISNKSRAVVKICLQNATCSIPVFANPGTHGHVINSIRVVSARTDIPVTEIGQVEHVLYRGLHVYRTDVHFTTGILGNKSVCFVATDNMGLQTEKCVDVLLYPRNACDDRPCQYASCVPSGLSFTCQCPPSTTGRLCDQWLNPCLSSPCQNSATCVSREPLPMPGCKCMAGFDGRFCETNIDDCREKPCHNGGTCVDEINGFHCLCEAGFTGPSCSTALSGLFWSSHSVADHADFRACPGDNVTFVWLLSAHSYTDLDVEWLYEGRSREIVALDSHGVFTVLPAFSGRVRRLEASSAAIVLGNVVPGDSGTYSVYVTGQDGVTGRVSRVHRSVNLQVAAGCSRMRGAVSVRRATAVGTSLHPEDHHPAHQSP